MMKYLKSKLVISIFTLFSLATCELDQKNECTITEFSQVSEVLNRCTDITVSNLIVPSGEALKLDLLKGSRLTFEGVTVFEVAYWEGFLVQVSGEGVLVEGAPGSILNAQGEKYWDGQGGNGGVTKPKFFQITTTGGSIFENIYLLNCAHYCVGINASDLTLTGWTIDVTAGNTGTQAMSLALMAPSAALQGVLDRGAFNTDGFGIGMGDNILIENSIVMNQDDCVVVNSGSNMLLRNIQCYGSHGLSFSVGSSNTDDSKTGVMKNITFSDCLVADGIYGIHLKTKKGTGIVSDVTYQNIVLSGIQEDGIYINQDYGDIGNLSRQIEITNLKMINIYGSVQGSLTRPVHVVCNENKCSDWTWSGINILGGGDSYCNFSPFGFPC